MCFFFKLRISPVCIEIASAERNKKGEFVEFERVLGEKDVAVCGDKTRDQYIVRRKGAIKCDTLKGLRRQHEICLFVSTTDPAADSFQ